MMGKAKVEYAPDGKHFHTVKTGTSENMWDYFVMNPEIRKNLVLNPQGKFRMIGETGLTIGILGYNKKKKEFMHLKDVI
jgi:hypothetical protein